MGMVGAEDISQVGVTPHLVDAHGRVKKEINGHAGGVASDNGLA